MRIGLMRGMRLVGWRNRISDLKGKGREREREGSRGEDGRRREAESVAGRRGRVMDAVEMR
jgi:hypothetical protein